MWNPLTYLDTIHAIIHGDGTSFMSVLIRGLWDIFSVTNGNPDTANYGIRFSISIFFTLFLLVILQLRAKMTLDIKHLIAFIGAVLLLIRYVLMMGFEWGWQIKLYDDWIIHFLFPPLEHFFYMMFFCCTAYYSLNAYNYYPGAIRRIIPYIPISLVAFFIYATIEWKTLFMSKLPAITKYVSAESDWQSHAIIFVIALYCFMVAIKQYKRYYCFLSAFWTITLIEHGIRTVCFYYHYEPAELATIFHAMQIWALPLLILHFTNAYVMRIGEPKERRRPPWTIPCEDCPKPEDEQAKMIQQRKATA